MMPPQTRLMDHLYLKINGDELPSEAMDDLVEVTVDTSLHYPDMFTIRLHDEALQWITSDLFGLGREVEIATVPDEGGRSLSLVKGEITALEPNFGEGTQAVLQVRGYDRSHRLHRGTHSQAFLQVTDSDLAARIADQAGLRSQVDPTPEVYAHVLQNNRTHMDFLSERAQRIGYELYVQDKTLHFKKPSSNGSAIELEWGREMISFQPRLTLVEQVDEVVVKGWDPKTRQVIVGQASRGQAEPLVGERQPGGEQAASAFSAARRVVVNRVVESQAEAETLAQAHLDEISGGFVEAEGVCRGLPQLRAGKTVRISALGARFNGDYFVTAAAHIYRADGGYTTSFSVSGRRPASLVELIERSQSAGADRSQAGAVIGVVTNNNDPEGWGRVKVKFPWLTEDVESSWARLAAPGAGPERGLYWLPEVNDEVLVVFEHGDPNRPFVIGGLWNGRDTPPAANSAVLENGDVHQRILKTRTGHFISFNDGSQAGCVIETSSGQRVSLSDEQKSITLETPGGLSITLNDSDSSITLASGGGLTIQAGADLTLEASGRLQLQGQAFSINANATGEVKAGATLDVSGAIVKIN